MAQIQIKFFETPQIKLRQDNVFVFGTVESVAEISENQQRIVLKDVVIPAFEKWQTPEKLWLNLEEKEALQKEDEISFKGLLNAPSKPSLPNSFDFARFLYFQKIGGVGVVKEELKILKRKDALSLREAINAKINKTLPLNSASIAKALITGEAKSIPDFLKQAYRKAGLSHLLSVSGLHLSLIAGLVFVLIRTGLVAFPSVCLRYDSRKIAAFLALFISFFYLKIAGEPYSAWRAFLMLSFVLLGILLNRKSVSMVSVSWAFFLILFFNPAALLSVGFQLSFGAVFALVSFYESQGKNISLFFKQKESLFFSCFSLIFYVCLTTFIACFATAPFILYHFQEVAIYSLLGNLFTSFLMSFWVMPALMFASFAMVFDCERPLLQLASYGIELINKAALFVADLPNSSLHTPPLSTFGFFLGVFGLFWICLWKGKAKLFGFVLLFACFISPFFSVSPDMIVSSKALAFKEDSHGFTFTKSSEDSFQVQEWLRVYPQKEVKTTFCPYGFCLYEKNGSKIGYAHTKIGAYDACALDNLDLLFLTIPFDETCKAKVIYTQADFVEKNVFTVFIKKKKIKVLSD